MKSFVNENKSVRDIAQNTPAEPVAGTGAKSKPAAQKGVSRQRLEVTWEAAPTQKVEMIALSAQDSVRETAPSASPEPVAPSRVRTTVLQHCIPSAGKI
jgi:hypothetical protein